VGVEDDGAAVGTGVVVDAGDGAAASSFVAEAGATSGTGVRGVVTRRTGGMRSSSSDAGGEDVVGVVVDLERNGNMSSSK
jgi:hypothetical protein